MAHATAGADADLHKRKRDFDDSGLQHGHYPTGHHQQGMGCPVQAPTIRAQFAILATPESQTGTHCDPVRSPGSLGEGTRVSCPTRSKPCLHGRKFSDRVCAARDWRRRNGGLPLNRSRLTVDTLIILPIDRHTTPLSSAPWPVERRAAALHCRCCASHPSTQNYRWLTRWNVQARPDTSATCPGPTPSDCRSCKAMRIPLATSSA